MKRFHIALLSAALLAGVAFTGCAPQEPVPGDEASTEAAAHNLNLQGDFKGPLGLQLWSVRDSMENDVPGTLQKVHDWGFREVEMAGTYGLSAQQFKQALDNAGIQATSMHVDYNLLRDSLDKVVSDAKTLGVKYLGVAWIPHPEDQPFSVEQAREAAANFNEWGQAMHDNGIQFFYHTHGYEFQPTADGTIPFDVLMNETDPTNVKYEMDVFWVTRPGQDPAALLKKYPDRWELMHVKDMKKGTPTNDFSGGAPATAEVPVGTGQIDYRGVLNAAQDIGLDEYYIEDETTDPFGNIPQSVSWLETVAY
ncbi:MAG TPA: TIM barrel protein [Rhodothermales bacterium]|nr:TIM barrel protein [Rhodothermales bacterium]